MLGDIVSCSGRTAGWAADNAGGAPATLDVVWAGVADSCGHERLHVGCMLGKLDVMSATDGTVCR